MERVSSPRGVLARKFSKAYVPRFYLFIEAARFDMYLESSRENVSGPRAISLSCDRLPAENRMKNIMIVRGLA